MCGIAGVLSQSQIRSDAAAIALNQLHHRGPDASGQWADEHIWIGHTRLAILDLSEAGRQPMSDHSDRYRITFNGEIYNYLELRAELLTEGYTFTSNTDTEVLLAAYAQWGVDCLKKLRGMFAFAIWDRDAKTLFLVRDRTGEKPLYYSVNQERFCFSSELKALLMLLPHTPELDPIAIDLYLHYHYVPEPRTPFKDVLKLPAGHYLLIELAQTAIAPVRYWSLDQIEPIEGNPGELIRAELDRAIELTLRSDVPVGIALSGGLDSGGIAALAAPKYKDVLQAFSVGYPGYPDCDERQQAKELAHYLGLPFHDVELRSDEFVDFFPQLVRLIDDPIADIAAFGHFAVTQLAAQHGIKVMLNGLGGDELFWGYEWVAQAVSYAERKHRNSDRYSSSITLCQVMEWLAGSSSYLKLASSHKVPGALRTLLQNGVEFSYVAPAYPNQTVFYNIGQDFRRTWHSRRSFYTKKFLEQLPARNAFEPFVVEQESWADIPNQVRQLLFETWLVSNCLSLGDRVSMASSVEVRLPLLDYRLIELVIGLSKTQPDHELGRKYWLKDVLKEHLPAEVLNRPKRGFEPPYGEWIVALTDRYKEQVLDGYLIKLGIFNRSYLQKLFQNCRNNYSLTYRILYLEIWYRSILMAEETVLSPTEKAYQI